MLSVISSKQNSMVYTKPKCVLPVIYVDTLLLRPVIALVFITLIDRWPNEIIILFKVLQAFLCRICQHIFLGPFLGAESPKTCWHSDKPLWKGQIWEIQDGRHGKIFIYFATFIIFHNFCHFSMAAILNFII